MSTASLHQADRSFWEETGTERVGLKKRQREEKEEAYVSKNTTGQIFSGTPAFTEKSLTV